MQYWWCNQSERWPVERPAGVVCAGAETNNPTYRKTVGEAEVGDIVVHYRTPNIVAFSRALENGKYHSPLPSFGDVSYGPGWRFKTDYHDLKHPVNRKDFANELAQLSKKHYAINANGNIKQAYFLPFDAAGVAVLLKHLHEAPPAWLSDSANAIFEPLAQDCFPNFYPEGSPEKVIVTRYRRDPRAREACLRHHGAKCYCCPNDLSLLYGEVWSRLIQVHHVIPLSSLGSDYLINPITELRPVCPNCHAFIHSRKPEYDPEEVRRLLQERWPR